MNLLFDSHSSQLRVSQFLDCFGDFRPMKWSGASGQNGLVREDGVDEALDSMDWLKRTKTRCLKIDTNSINLDLLKIDHNQFRSPKRVDLDQFKPIIS